MKYNLCKTLLFVYIAIGMTGCPLTKDDTSSPIVDGDDSDTLPLDTDTTADTDTTVDTDTGPLDLDEDLILEYTGSLRNLACWGDYVAWALFEEAGNKIVVMNSSGSTNEIPADIYGNHSLVMSSEAIAWDNHDVDALPFTRMDVFYSALMGTTGNPHMQTDNDERSPRIDGNRVAWFQYTDAMPVLNVGTLGSDTVQGFGGLAANDPFDISGGKVVLVPNSSTIMVKDLNGGADIEMTVESPPVKIRISGDHIVYYVATNFGNDTAIILQNIQTKEVVLVADGLDADGPVGLDVDGNYVAYGATDVLQGAEITAVFVYDIAQRKLRQAATGYDGIWDVAIGGGRIAWLVGDEFLSSDPSLRNWKIYSALLP
ncbi:MAG: hypothetical protein GY847_18520 [Proteobacteria bacterium]|nr:hypothetical protein [Pseudomonadota bacterium]